MLPSFLKAVPVLKRIEDHGYEAYFVGGSVRDSILGREIADVDIASSALPEELKRIFSHTVDVGIAHGTILVIYEGIPYEMTTFRTESGYSDYRRPDQVEFVRSLTEDLKRRDFTMNAMAMNRKGELIDPFDGKGAILMKQIVTVGEATERFSEDALRMMRAVRFVSQLGFTIEENTFNSLGKMAPLLEKIAVERKLIEFEKMLVGEYREKALMLLSQTGLNQFLPGLSDRNEHLDHLSKWNLSHLSLEEMWTLLIYQLRLTEMEASKFLRAWKLPVKKAKKYQNLLYWLQFSIENKWNSKAAYHAGKETMLVVERVRQMIKREEEPLSERTLIELYESLPIKSRLELQVTGNDLLSWIDKDPGPWMKECLTKIEEKVVTGELVNAKCEIRKWVVQCNPK